MFVFYFFLHILTQAIFGIDTIATGFKLLSGASVTIDAHSLCKEVTNNSANDRFVSTKTSTGWNSFLTNTPANYVLADCGAAGGTTIITDQGILTNTSAQTSYTFSSIDLGDVSENRMVIVLINAQAKDGAGISSVTLAGQTLTEASYARADESVEQISAIYYGENTTDSSADLVVNFSGSGANVISVNTQLTYGLEPTPYDNSSMNSTVDNITSLATNINILENGVSFAASSSVNYNQAISWVGANVIGDNNVASTSRHTFSSVDTSSTIDAHPISVGMSDGDQNSLAVASWRPKISDVAPISSNSNFLVATYSKWNGALGGLSGANQKCIDELSTAPWLGSGNVPINAQTTKALLCDSSGCQKLKPNRTYTYDSTANSASGINDTLVEFSTDPLGRGPNDSLSWSTIGSIFDAAYTYYWTGLAQGSSTEYIDYTPSVDTCSDWTVGNSAAKGTYGRKSATDATRWSNTNITCSFSWALLCIVDGDGSECSNSGGVLHDNQCWFLGDAGEDCYDTCNNPEASSYHSPLDSTALGSSGTNTECRTALDLLLNSSSGSVSSTAGSFGCGFDQSTGQRKRGTAATTLSSTAGNFKRLCACSNDLTGSSAGSGESSSSSTSHTFSNIDIGTPYANRLVIVAVNAEVSNGNNLTGVTIGGSPMTQAVEAKADSTSEQVSAIFYKIVSSGETASIVVTFSGAATAVGISTSVTYAMESTPYDTSSSNSTSSNTSLSININMKANGFLMAGASGHNATDSYAVSGANQILNSNLSGIIRNVSAIRNTSSDLTSHPIAVSYNSSSRNSLAAASWEPMTTDCSSVGEVCLDGTIYAGTSPDGSVPMYTTPCDVGMTWDGVSCTGSAISYYWNNGNSWSNSPNMSATTTTDGDGNTALLVATDSDTSTAGTQPHQAAQACDQLNINGKTDWYLPSTGELLVLYNNRNTILNFDSTNYYSSSTQGVSYSSFRSILFSSGSEYTSTKGTTSRDYNYIRCVRK